MLENSPVRVRRPYTKKVNSLSFARFNLYNIYSMFQKSSLDSRSATWSSEIEHPSSSGS
jgi:hypothetical protein